VYETYPGIELVKFALSTSRRVYLNSREMLLHFSFLFQLILLWRECLSFSRYQSQAPIIH
jgi:hypothetical protein